jgi:steroid delta-isomerase-like uncharacterized protein
MKTISRFATYLAPLLAAGVLALSGCSTPGSSTSVTADSDRAMMKAFESYKAAWNRHDVAGLTAYFQPNGVYISPEAGRLSGPALSSWLQGLFAGIPDFKVESVSANPVGDRMIASQWVIKGTWTQPFPGGPLAGAKPTGKSFAVPGASFYEWKDGKIALETAYFDQMALLVQIGVIAKK